MQLKMLLYLVGYAVFFIIIAVKLCPMLYSMTTNATIMRHKPGMQYNINNLIPNVTISNTNIDQNIISHHNNFNYSYSQRDSSKTVEGQNVASNTSSLRQSLETDWNKLGYVINPQTIRSLITENDLCVGKNVSLLVYINSNPKRNAERDAIRNTWGNIKHHDKFTIVVIFFFGINYIHTHQKQLEYESDTYHDIIQMDFLDTYQNLSYKGLTALKWVNDHCNHAEYVLKTDDDMIVNIFEIVRHLKTNHPFGFGETLTWDTLFCYGLFNAVVERKGRWGVPKSQFPDKYYPPYCAGLGFITTTASTAQMYDAHTKVPFLWIEDAFIAGVLPKAAGLKIHPYTFYTTIHNADSLQRNLGPELRQTFFIHANNIDMYYRAWPYLFK